MDAIPIAVAGLAALAALLVGIALDRFVLQKKSSGQLARAQKEAQQVRADTERELERLRRERVEEPEAAVQRQRRELEQEQDEARRSMRRSKERLEQRQAKLNKRAQRVNDREQALHKATEAVEAVRKETERQAQAAEALRRQIQAMHDDAQSRRQRAEKLEQEAEERLRHVETRDEELNAERQRLQQMIDEQVRKLEQVSGLTSREAREMLLEQFEDEAKLEAASLVKEIRDEAKLKANREARKVILTAIQRTAASHAIENTVSVVNIQSDEMKGRIIGREGRNIRAFEAATGIEVIVDDTPEAVILSGFNPVRREIARISLIRLVQDGRIHPARIEEVVEKVSDEIEEEIIETGERTVIDLSLHGMHPELIKLVGRMRYRSSYGQNVLAHSIETARIASLIAAELNLDATLARRAGLLHDIGKVVEEDIEQPHAIVGMELCRKYKEHADVCNAVGAHHDEMEMTAMISPIVQAADAISGARPGARREALENYIRRLEKLEELAAGFDGVGRVYAIQAGREIRVIVNHELVSDAQAEQLAGDISKKIQNEMQYPGQVKVTVIREVRSVAYAK